MDSSIKAVHFSRKTGRDLFPVDRFGPEKAEQADDSEAVFIDRPVADPADHDPRRNASGAFFRGTYHGITFCHSWHWICFLYFHDAGGYSVYHVLPGIYFDHDASWQSDFRLAVRSGRSTRASELRR